MSTARGTGEMVQRVCKNAAIAWIHEMMDTIGNHLPLIVKHTPFLGQGRPPDFGYLVCLALSRVVATRSIPYCVDTRSEFRQCWGANEAVYRYSWVAVPRT